MIPAGSFSRPSAHSPAATNEARIVQIHPLWSRTAAGGPSDGIESEERMHSATAVAGGGNAGVKTAEATHSAVLYKNVSPDYRC